MLPTHLHTPFILIATMSRESERDGNAELLGLFAGGTLQIVGKSDCEASRGKVLVRQGCFLSSARVSDSVFCDNVLVTSGNRLIPLVIFTTEASIGILD